jgi:hypothetical protein
VKVAVLIYLILAAITVSQEQPPRFGLSGRVALTKATRFMDGGSILVNLQDDLGNGLSVLYTNLDYPPSNHPGQLAYSTRGSGRVYVERGSSQEQELLHLLGAACNNTFGTADPEALRDSSLDKEGRIGDWSRSNMCMLFWEIAGRNRPKNNR